MIRGPNDDTLRARQAPAIEDLPLPPAGRVGWPWTESSDPVPDQMPDGSAWPRITIVMPSYNQAAYLEEAIRSVLLQGYPNLEFLIRDGGSTDQSVSIISCYEQWIHAWVSMPDAGQADALNQGFAQATGLLIGWLNSDDLLLPHALRQLALSHHVHPDAVLLGDVDLFTDDGTFSQIAHQSQVTFENMVKIWGLHMRWAQPGTYVPRRIHEQIGPLDATLRYVFDRDWMCRLLRQTSVHYLDEPIARFRMHPTSKTIGEAARWLPEQIRVTERYLAEVAGVSIRRARAEQELWYGALPNLSVIRQMDRRAGLRHLIAALQYDYRVGASARFLLLCAILLTPTPILRMVRKYVQI